MTVSAGGFVLPASAVTNSSGYATFSLTAPTTACKLTINASCNGAQASHDVQVVAGIPAALQILSPPGLLPADGYCMYTLLAKATDMYGNGCSGWPVNLTIDGTASTVNAGPDGTASYLIGPRYSKHIYNVTAVANGHSQSVSVRFIEANIYLLNYPSSVPAGQNVTITALLLDDLTPAPGILLNFTVYSPNSLAVPSAFAGLTDQNGMVNFTFRTSTKAGMNSVIVSNQSLGGDLKYASIRGIGGQVSQIVLATDPSPAPADGSTNCVLKIWARDSGGNPVKSEDLTIVRNYAENYSVTTNTNGYAEIGAGSSPYVGTVRFDVYAQNGVTNNILVSYVAGPPAMTVIKAVPNVIASSDVPQPQGMTDVHTTEIIAQVSDQWHHPLPGYNITVSPMNATAGTIVGPTNGVTDANGEFYTQFMLGNRCNGTGTVYVQAVSGAMSSIYPITYTNNSFLSVDTSIAPRNISVNGTINVDISIKGLGWNNRPQPVDMLLITDRSGSMDWYSTYVYPSSGTPITGTLAINDKEYLIATYNNTQYSALQFMLSSPYTNYDNGSYYYGLKITDPTGSNKTGTRSANENYYQFASARTGVYKIYAKATYSGAGGTPPYSYAVLTKPLRLGSAWLDNNSAAKMAATQLANNMTYLDQMGLVSFSTSATLNAGLKVVNGTNKTGLINAISSLDANDGTNVYTGIQKARTEFAAHGRSFAKRVAILLSDGYSQSPASDIVEAANAKNDGIMIFTIGMGMADANTLGTIANITGGLYYHVASDLELADRYQQIFKNVSDVIANESSMDIISTRSVVNGTLLNDTQYIPGSAIVTFTNGTKAQIEPTITLDGSNYTLNWDPGVINCNQIWDVNYQLKAMRGGFISPIAANSFISFKKSDGTSGIVNIGADSIFCQGAVEGHVGTTSPSLVVHILSPGNQTAADQLRVMISWSVAYTGADSYTQRISVLPAESEEWMDIGRGFEGDRSSPGAYAYWWSLERVPTGNYTIQVFITDGTYDAQDEVTISIPYRSGQIVLQ